MFVTSQRTFLLQKVLFAQLKTVFPTCNIKQGFLVIYVGVIQPNNRELSEPSWHPHTLLLRTVSKLTSHLHLGLPSVSLPSQTPSKMMYIFLSLVCALYTVHLFHVGFTAQIIFATKYKLWRFRLLILSISRYLVHDKSVHVTTAWRILSLQLEKRLPVWREASNILNKKSRTANKGLSSS